jgi:3-hydroxyisobutyrate dehydrogenase
MQPKDININNTTIGFIGLGVMGNSMAMHLHKAGFKINVYNRSREKTKQIVDAGAKLSNNIPALAKDSQVIITMLGMPSDVEEVYCSENGILNNAKSDTICIDMTTSSPLLAKKIAEAAKEKQIYIIDAPVSGGDIGAKNATLSIMVGGDKIIYGRILTLLKFMGENIVFQGTHGNGQHTKMANQIVVAGNMIGVCESLAYALKAGLDPKKVLDSISKGAAGSWALTNLAPRILDDDFAPGFYIKHFIKDMRIALECATENGCDTPGLKTVLEQYQKLADMGFENDGTQALSKAYN